jgi:thioesterase domain-containing protein
MSRHIDNEMSSASGSALSQGSFPVTPLQERFWRLQKQHPQSTAGNIAMRWRLLGATRDQSIELALQALIDRHEILRTAFKEKSGVPEQIVRPAEIKLGAIDLTRLAPEMTRVHANNIAMSEGRKPFALDNPPLMRGTILRLAAKEAILLLTFHHCVMDGWSVGIIARELASLIDSLEKGAVAVLPDPELQYGDFALWKQECLTGDALNNERRFWKRQLQGVQDIRIASSHIVEAAPAEEAQIRSILLPLDFVDRFKEAVRRESQTPFSLACACLARVAGAAAGTNEIVIGSQIASRNEELLFGVVGPVVNTVPLRITLSGHDDRTKFLRHCRERINEAFDNSALPFEHIVRLAARADAAGGDDAVFNIRLNFGFQAANVDTDNIGAVRSGSIELVSIPSVSTGALYDLGFFMVQRQEGWRISCEYAADRYDDTFVDGLLQQWREELEAVTLPAVARTPSLSTAALREPRASYFSLFAMQPDGDLPPIFAINNRSAYYPIAKYLGTSRPFIDIHWRDEATPPPLSADSIPELAADVVRLVRSIDPYGPYYFMGHCMLGNVAFETARQLLAAGAEVATIFLLDTIAPGYIETMPRRDRILRRIQLLDHSWHYFMHLVREVRRGDMTLRTALSHYHFIRDNPIRQLGRKLGLANQPKPSVRQDLMNNGLMYYLRDAKSLYKYESYEGDVVFFRSAEARTGRLFARGFGWDRIVRGSFHVYDVPGTHLQMTRDPGASVIAAHAAWLMDRREGRWRLPDDAS